MADAASTLDPLAAALDYAARGWAVIPLHSFSRGGCSCGRDTCSSPGKHPRTQNGLKDATTDREQIEGWWSAWPDANVGIRTGADSNLVVLDIDAKSNGEQALAGLEAEHGPVPATATALTGGGGRHLLFEHPDVDVRNSASKLGPGLDIRGDGGYIVAAPSGHTSGRCYAWQEQHAPADLSLAELPGWLLALLTSSREKSAKADGTPVPLIGEKPIVEGQRNATLASIAGRLRRDGQSEEEIYLALLDVNQSRVIPPLPETEVAAIAASISRYDPAPVVPAWVRFKRTEYGNAERLVDRHGVDLRHSASLGWLVWDGQRWRRDEDGEAMRRMKETVRAMWDELPEIEDEKVQASFFGFVRSSENERRLNAALKLAESEAAVVVSADAFDADPFLFAVGNGTIDLRTGELYSHRRDDLITKASTVEYVPGVRSELWQDFLHKITAGDEELERFLQRAAGYSLTGSTAEEKLFFPHGPAATGKSTFLEALKAVLGDYATTTDFETLLKRKGDRGIPNDIARLAGTRLVVSIEVDEGKQLAAGLVKQLTGGDTVIARFLRKEFFEFKPQFKLWLAANDRPQVSATDSGIWRRIVQIPFTVEIPADERDPMVKQRLTGDPEIQTAILAWAVDGALAWQEHGLDVPSKVRAYTEEYRQENDPLQDFLDECCLLAPEASVTRKGLRKAYERWAWTNHRPQLTARRFADLLKTRGVIAGGKEGQDRTWVGITLIEEGQSSEVLPL
jgi:putative DNA primase/helicase